MSARPYLAMAPLGNEVMAGCRPGGRVWKKPSVHIILLFVALRCFVVVVVPFVSLSCDAMSCSSHAPAPANADELDACDPWPLGLLSPQRVVWASLPLCWSRGHAVCARGDSSLCMDRPVIGRLGSSHKAGHAR